MTSAVQLLDRVAGNVCSDDMIEKGVLCVVECGSAIGLLTLTDDHGQCVVLRKILRLPREEVTGG
jgi:hypothetical protein